MSTTQVDDTLALLDWRRRIAELYAAIRAESDAGRAWAHWHRTRTRLLREHPQSPVALTDRASFFGPRVYPSIRPGGLWRESSRPSRSGSSCPRALARR